MSYQPFVQKKLSETCEVCGPEENCQFSLYTLSSIGRWLEYFGEPDIFHINIGLHDVGHNPKRNPHQIPLDMYIGNLTFIIEILLEKTKKIIWATTTPVHSKRSFTEKDWSWNNGEIDEYNAAALRLMKTYSILINDLHSLVADNIDSYVVDDGVHLNEKGQIACSDAVVGKIKSLI